MTTSGSDLEADRIRNVYAERDRRGYRARYAWYQRDVLLRETSLRLVLAEFLHSAFGNDLSNVETLDVGCGTGVFLRNMVEWGAEPSNLIGTEFLEDRLTAARAISPAAVRWHLGGMEGLDPEKRYDLVSAFTVLSSILDDEQRQLLLSSMWQKVKPGGWLLIFDFGVNNPANRDVRKVTRSELDKLVSAKQKKYRKVVLVPPLARRVSPLSTLAAQVLELIPVLRTHFVYMAQK